MKHMKKLLIVLVLFTVLTAAFIISASAAELAYGAATINATTLNIRSGPGTEYERVSCAPSGARIVVLAKNSDGWYKVNYNGDVGYVDSSFLKEVVTRENFEATGEITGTDVRMRKSPNTDSDVIMKFNTGDRLDVIGINEGWYKITYKDKTGYVRSDLMNIVDRSAASVATFGQQVAAYAQKFLGYRYIYGAESPSSGFDCSGLVYYVYGQFGYKLSRTASQQYKNDGIKVAKAELQPGDLVFFSSNGYSVTHVGIYIGDNEFIHASTSDTGVIISSLTSSYYMGVWFGAKRIAS